MEDFAVGSREHVHPPEGAPGQRPSAPGRGAGPGAGAGAGPRGPVVGPEVSTPGAERDGGRREKHKRWGKGLKAWKRKGRYKRLRKEAEEREGAEGLLGRTGRDLGGVGHRKGRD